jgi:hypothetical protein
VRWFVESAGCISSSQSETMALAGQAMNFISMRSEIWLKRDLRHKINGNLLFAPTISSFHSVEKRRSLSVNQNCYLKLQIAVASAIFHTEQGARDTLEATGR